MYSMAGLPPLVGGAEVYHWGLVASRFIPSICTPVTATDEPHLWAENPRPVGPGDRASEPVLNVLTKPLLGGQLRPLGAAGLQLRLPLRDRRPIVEPAATRGCVAAQLTGDRRRGPADLAGNRPHAETLPSEQCDVFAQGTTGTCPTAG